MAKSEYARFLLSLSIFLLTIASGVGLLAMWMDRGIVVGFPFAVAALGVAFIGSTYSIDVARKPTEAGGVGDD